MIKSILASMDFPAPKVISQFQNEEDGEFYPVWRVDYMDQVLVLKQAKGNEADIYRHYLSKPCSYAPRMHAITETDGKVYLLMEYIPGHDLKKAHRDDWILALNALIAMQKDHLGDTDPIFSYQTSLEGRKRRRQYLLHPRLEQAYDAYLAQFSVLPRTLCHDDLLPFNVIVSENRGVLIDWEVAGYLPYLTSFALLIAHGEEEETAFFHLKASDRTFAIEYYFQHFVKKMGIDYESYRHSLNLFLFYEYCEWVYVGNRYNDTDNSRFRNYQQKALEMAAILGF